jgi:hypothetical protein
MTRRREALLVAAIVLASCLAAIVAFVPANWHEQLVRVEATMGLPVADVAPWFSQWAFGDGSAFAVIATDPLGFDLGETLYDPGYRYLRAGFGWVLWGVSLGQAKFVPYAMTLVGLSCVVVLFLLAKKYHPILGAASWLLVLNPAVFIALASGTAEALGVLLLALGTARAGSWWSVPLGLTRPTYLIALISHRRAFVAGVLASACLFGYGVWRFGWDLGQYTGVATLPFVGFIQAAGPGSWIVALAAVATLLVGLIRWDWAWVASAVFVLCFSALVVENSVNALRAAGALPVLWAFGPRWVPTRAQRDLHLAEQPADVA